jgi:hypothetical protein
MEERADGGGGNQRAIDRFVVIAGGGARSLTLVRETGRPDAGVREVCASR